MSKLPASFYSQDLFCTTVHGTSWKLASLLCIDTNATLPISDYKIYYMPLFVGFAILTTLVVSKAGQILISGGPPAIITFKGWSQHSARMC